ncbi:MAG: class I SAM-dependent methyltransferase [Spirochaetota bacterium]|nr:class I SAM-dependent methyltransferase [Spirochaetota bacterium]
MSLTETICPICNSNKYSYISTDVQHIQRCKRCNIIFNSNHLPCNYDNKYFTDEYSKQYGRSYIEDFENIYALSLTRLQKIFSLNKDNIKPKNVNLLDIGSAMGFFLKAAKDSGIENVKGIEVSSFAAEYCKKKYNFDVINSSFEDVDFDRSYDIITAWYFIEHCETPIEILRKIYNILSPKGIFAFSVPSSFGPQYIFNKSQWAKMQPADHRIYLTPFLAKKILKKLGFKQIITKPGGLHPERIISRNSFLFSPFNPVYSLFSRIFCFSDTFEIYARKDI